jgi:hypothetical protein
MPVAPVDNTNKVKAKTAAGYCFRLFVLFYFAWPPNGFGAFPA